MRFLANAHLVVLGLLSLGITAYAQEHCRTSLDCGPNECCNTTRSPIFAGTCRPLSVEGPIVDVAAPLPRQDDPEQGDDDSDE
ncbi:hypothetical protein B0H14DRAFT_3516823 [Mycena olivaceomarginata]|nr:hypothetical protein B0H14DRAFT_3516823 [Mycena olivaceomarginata]